MQGDNMTAREYVRQYCRKNKLRHIDFAKKAGVGKATVSKFIQGGEVNLTTFKKIVHGAEGKIKIEFQ